VSQATDIPWRWSLNKAAEEFGCTRQTIKKRVVRAGINPGDDGMYSTKEIVSAVFGDKEGETIRKLKAEADLAEMERDERAAILLPADVVQQVWESALGEWRAIVAGFDIPKAARHRLLEQMKRIPINDYTERAVSPDEADPS
jgi:hypothetical protein